ncbi:hypothetical protein JCM10599A_01600 [Paraburkholderia kururiensis]
MGHDDGDAGLNVPVVERRVADRHAGHVADEIALPRRQNTDPWNGFCSDCAGHTGLLYRHSIP